MDVEYSPSNPLNYVMVQTWDDYEEGTEIETGIDNCLQAPSLIPAVNQSSSQLKWSYSFTENLGQPGSPNTVAYYNIYYAPNGCTQASQCSGFTSLASGITNITAGCAMEYPAVQCTGIMLDNYSFPQGGQYGIFVQAVGQPGISNWFSPVGVAYTAQ